MAHANGWIKLFGQIITSSIWEEPLHVRVTWFMFMAQCGMDGIAYISEASVARTANITQEQAEEALRTLQSPDPKSRSAKWDGRRIEKCDGGFRVLNYFEYRGINTPEKKSAYMRGYMREYRKKNGTKSCKANSKTRREKLTEKEGEEEWRDSYRLQAEVACATLPPADFPEVIRNVLLKFSAYREEMATAGKTKRDCAPWTQQMVEALHTQTKLQIGQHPPETIADRILGAASSGYRSVRFTNFFS